ncbi:ER membrane protein complex subunit 10 [Colias croceus]|uniref:ER membrane protein complex subunit 10 n=1 Tax=Colias crocea TaxID=72248 RepID=UPI001E27B55F|nr:ER membrane protein complex subunit 10 [Colias croceus]
MMKPPILFIVLFIQYAICLDYDGWLNIRIEHSLNCKEDKYCNRGNISLKSIRAGTATIDQNPLSQQHIDELKELASIDGFYTLRTFVTTADSKETEFLSSVKAKAFLENGLSDVISAWVLPSGEVIAVTFQVTNSSQSHGLHRSDYDIHSDFYLRHVDQAPVPDTASYIQKLEREREAREKGELKDNRSFLAKYWMYIVPIAIFVMISGATNPEGGAQPSR